MKQGYVYFLLDRASMLMKVGYTTRKLLRFEELQTGNGNHLELLGLLQSSPAGEDILHDALSELRERGEWFRVGEDQISIIEEFCDAEEERILIQQLEKSLDILRSKKNDVAHHTI